MADQTSFRQRYRITDEVARMLPAGVIALILLVIAVIALPRTTTKTVQSQGATGSEATGLESTTSGSAGNVPGAGTAGLRADASRAGSGTSGRASGPNVYVGTNNTAHVTSRFIPAWGPGVTNKYVYVGVAYSLQSGAGDSAIGAAGAAPSYDSRDVFNAVVDYANKHGGFAGRLLKPLYYDIAPR